MITEHVSFTHGEPLQPEELDLLQRVFDETCAQVGIEKKRLQAEGLAATLLKLIQSGLRDEKELKAAISTIDFI